MGIQEELSHTLRGGRTQAVAYAIQERAVSENLNAGPQGMGVQADLAYTLEARHHVQAAAYDVRGREGGAQFEGPHDTANIRAASGGSSRSYVVTWAVRRLTPVECARLQGFPDQWTAIARGKAGADDCADGPQYKAYGNSMAVNVMRWIGQRIDMVDRLP
jgi:DNA (cytosine-5)-methyltransferase 1